MLDRLKAAMTSVARGAQPTIDYLPFYRGKLVKQHANLRRVDVVPTDPRLPAMSNIPLRTGVAGAEQILTPGDDVLVGWENGWPDQPFAESAPAAPGGKVPVRTTLHATKIELGENTLATEGVLNGLAVDPFTGLQHWQLGNASTRVGAKK